MRVFFLHLLVICGFGFELYVPPLPIPEDVRSELSIVMDAKGDMVAVWLENSIVYVSDLPRDGAWTIPSPLSSVVKKSSSPRMAIDATGETTILWMEENCIKTATRAPKGTWSISIMEPTLLEVTPKKEKAKSRLSVGLSPLSDDDLLDGALASIQVGSGSAEAVEEIKSATGTQGPMDDPGLLPMANAIDAPTSTVLSGAQIGFAAGTAAPANGLVVSGKFGVATSSIASTNYIEFGGSSFSGSASCQFFILDPTVTCSSSANTFVLQYINPTWAVSANQTLTTAINLSIQTGSASLGSGAAITTGYGLFVNKPNFGTNKYTAYFDTVVGIGATPGSDKALIVGGDLRQANVNYGVYLDTLLGTATVTTISSAALLYLYPDYSLNAGTVTSAYGLLVDTAAAGTGTITTGYGVYINALSYGTTRYGLYVARPTGGTNNYTAYFDNNCGIGNIASTVNFIVTNTNSSNVYNVEINGTITSADGSSNAIGIFNLPTFNPTLGASNCYGLNNQCLFVAPSTKTISSAVNTWVFNYFTGNAGTITNAYGILVDAGGGNVGTITTAYSLYVNKPAHGTNKYTAYFDNNIGIGNTPTSYIGLWNGGGVTSTSANAVQGFRHSPSLGCTSGTMANCYSMYCYPDFTLNSATITTAFGLLIDVGGTAGTITNGVNFCVTAANYGTNKYTAKFDISNTAGVGIGGLPFSATGLTITAASGTAQMLRLDGTAQGLDGASNIAAVVVLPTLRPQSACNGAYGAYFQTQCNTTNANITNAYGVFVEVLSNTGGTLTNGYGLYVNMPTGGTTKICAGFTGVVLPIGTTKTIDLGSTTNRWGTVYGQTLTSGTSRLANSRVMCNNCNQLMKRGTGTVFILGEDADFISVFCTECGEHKVEKIQHLPKARLLERRPAPKIEFRGFKVNQHSGNSRAIQVLYRYVDRENGDPLTGQENSTCLSDSEYEYFLALSEGGQRAYLRELGQREWDAIEEVRLMKEECSSLQAQLDAIGNKWVGQDLLQEEE